MSDPHGTPRPEGEAPDWLDDPRHRGWIFWGVVGLYVVVVLAGFLPYARHPYFDFESIPAFQALYGLGCCIGLVLGASWLRTWLMRDEDYYDGP